MVELVYKFDEKSYANVLKGEWNAKVQFNIFFAIATMSKKSRGMSLHFTNSNLHLHLYCFYLIGYCRLE